MTALTEGVRLKDLIREVHEELVLSEQQREEEGFPALFEVEGLDLELHFVVHETDSVRAGFDLKIFSLGSDFVGSSEKVHKITLRLRAADSLEASSRRPGMGSGLRPKRDV